MIPGESDELPPGTQRAPKRLPTYPTSTTGGGGKSESSPLKTAEAALGQTTTELHRRARAGKCRANDKNASSKHQLVWETARAKYEEAEMLVASVADVGNILPESVIGQLLPADADEASRKALNVIF